MRTCAPQTLGMPSGTTIRRGFKRSIMSTELKFPNSMESHPGQPSNEDSSRQVSNLAWDILAENSIVPSGIRTQETLSHVWNLAAEDSIVRSGPSKHWNLEDTYPQKTQSSGLDPVNTGILRTPIRRRLNRPVWTQETLES